MDGTIAELLKQGDPDSDKHALKGEILGIKGGGGINYEAKSEVCLCVNCTYRHTRVCKACECVRSTCGLAAGQCQYNSGHGGLR